MPCHYLKKKQKEKKVSSSRRWGTSKQEPEEEVSLFLISPIWGKGKLVEYKQDSDVFSSDQYRGKMGIDAIKRKTKVLIHFS